MNRLAEKIFNNSLTKKIAVWLFALLLLLGFSYYYYNYHQDSFLTLLVISLVALVVVIILLLTKRLIDYKKWLAKILKPRQLSLFKLIFVFFLAAVVFLNLLFFIYLFAGQAQLKDILLMELSVIAKIGGLLVFQIVLAIFIWSLGSKLIKLFKLKTLSDSEELVFGFGLGLIPLSLIIFALGAVKILYWQLIFLAVITLAVWAWEELKKNFSRFWNCRLNFPFMTGRSGNDYQGILLIIGLIFLFFIFLSGIMPQPIDADALHTYYNGPKLSLEQHALAEFPLFPFAETPSNLNLLHIGVLALTGSLFLSNLQLLYFIFTLIVLTCFARRFINKESAFFAGAIYFLIPSTIIFFIVSVKIELSLVFYSLLIVYAFFFWLQEGKGEWAIVLGLLAGFGLGIKYNTLFLLISLLAAFAVFFGYRLFKKQAVKDYLIQGLLITAFALLIFSPWLVRNQLKFDNPWHPFDFKTGQIDRVWLAEDQTDLIELVDEGARNYNLITLQDGYQGWDYIWRLPMIYLRGTFHANNLNDFSPIFLLALPLLFLTRKNFNEKILIIICLVYFLLWLDKGYARWWYAFPLFLFLSILIGSAASQLKFIFKNKLIIIIFASLIALNFFFVLSRLFTGNSFYLLAIENKEEFLQRNLFIYSLSQRLNEELRPGERVLLLATMKSAFIKNNDQNTIIDSKNKKYFNYLINQTPEESYEMIKKDQVAYIIYDYNKMNFLESIPYLRDLKMLKNPAYQKIISGLNLFKTFEKRYLEEIICLSQTVNGPAQCLYRVK